jgi:hypothetical protein
MRGGARAKPRTHKLKAAKRTSVKSLILSNDEDDNAESSYAFIAGWRDGNKVPVLVYNDNQNQDCLYTAIANVT